MTSLPGVELVRGHVPGAIGRVVELHGAYYHRHWDFGSFFECKVAAELSEFMQRYDDVRDGFWSAWSAGQLHGSVSIDGKRACEKGAHLRWFILSDALRGKGIGSQLIESAVAHCRTMEYPSIYLWTFEGLDAAKHLYEKVGFTLVEQARGTHWGVEVNEQRFELHLD